MKKLSKLQKWYLKYFDNEAYQSYKIAYRFSRDELQRNTAFEQSLRNLSSLPPINFDRAIAEPSFRHSGNSGDIIYSLPAVFALAPNGGARFYLKTNQKLDHPYFHPLGNMMLNDKMVSMLSPLLLHQPGIQTCEPYRDQEIDYDLDLFRTYIFQTDRGSISRWYFQVFAVFADLSRPWLIAPKEGKYGDYIVIARSHRYRQPFISYAFLQQYPKKLFLGVPEEFEDLRREIPDLEYHPVTDFLELATVINSCRFFIGNQSFPFAIAEALKVQRVLEVYYHIPNVIVEGAGGHDFLYQEQFEHIVKTLFSKTA